jgi:hypothetical protein
MVSKRVAEMAETLVAVARPGITPKELFEKVRHRHPKASRKEIARAAYFALISHSSNAPEKADGLRALAVASRPTLHESDD